MKLDKERTGWGLSVRTDLPEALLKEKMNLAAECMRDIFVPSDVVREGDRYTFYISHRQSLKEFISENGIGVRDFFALLQRIGKLFEDAQEHGLKPHEFIFDYECIFVGDSPEDLEFIYAPDADAYKDGIVVYNKCSDLAALVSLHIEYGTAEQNMHSLRKKRKRLSRRYCVFYRNGKQSCLRRTARSRRNGLLRFWNNGEASETVISQFLLGAR